MLSLEALENHIFKDKPFSINEEAKQRVALSFEFLSEYSKSRVIYGINTGFGPMAQYRISSERLGELQYNLILSHSSGCGQPLEDHYAKAVMLARLNNFLQGNSGISPQVIEKLGEFLDKNIIPEIYESGGVGASGDLVQLAHLALNLIGQGFVRIDGQRVEASIALRQKEIKPLKLQLRDGLGLINGTSCMTAIGAINLIFAKKLFDISLLLSCMVNELVEAFDDSFSENLNSVKLHKGQQLVARQMRNHLSNSQMIRKREPYFEQNELGETVFQTKVQEYYSIRCVPQILGPVWETIENGNRVLEDELNSTSDNPIVDFDHQGVFHGGNFHGDYVSLEMDKLKMVVTKMAMLAERQLNFLLNDKANGIFPPFLNAKELGLNFGIQGMQFAATSSTAENQMLSNPMYVHSIPCNNDNQDIVSMGTNAALIAKRVIDNAYQVFAIHSIAVCQALDLLPKDILERFSQKSRHFHEKIRSEVNFIEKDLPQFDNIKKTISLLKQYSYT